MPITNFEGKVVFKEMFKLLTIENGISQTLNHLLNS